MSSEDERTVDSTNSTELAVREFARQSASDRALTLKKFVEQLSPAVAAEAFEALLRSDLSRRISQGEQPKASDYRSSFSKHAPIIDRVFASFSQSLDATMQLHATTPPIRSATEPPIDATVQLNQTLPLSERPLPSTSDPTRIDLVDRTMRLDKEATHTDSLTSAQMPSDRKTIGDYELVSEIARGGMGVVYRARQISLDRPVALKMILAGSLAGVADVRRFRQEAESAAKLDHPGIVPIYDVGERDGTHYFAMALVDGGSLADRIREQPLEPREAATLMAEIADAIAYAHARGVIHRDLKPANVLLDRNGKPHVTDFGLAKKLGKSAENELTTTGQILGTPAYMPPEQALGDVANIGTHSDVYSLGAMLYAMLTAKPPHVGSSPIETLRLVVNAEPASIRSINGEVPRDLETICLKCLSKAPERRYSSAQSLAADLRRYVAGEPIEARAVGRGERAYRWARRHPALSSAIALGVCLVLLLSIGGPLIAINQASLREKADDAAEDAKESLLIAEDATREREAALEQSEAARRSLAEANDRSHEELVARTVSQAYQSRTPAGIGVGLLSTVAPDDRGWDWDFVTRLAEGAERTHRGLPTTPEIVAFDSENQTAIAAGESGSNDSIGWASWTTEAGLFELHAAHRVLAVDRSAQRLLRALPSGELQWLDPSSDEPLEQFRFPSETVYAAIADNAPRIATVGRNQKVTVWELGKTAPIADWVEENRRQVHSIGISPTGSWVGWVSRDNQSLYWRSVDRPEEEAKRIEFQNETPMNSAPQFSPDDRWLVLGVDRRVLVFDVATGERRWELFGHTGDITAVDVSPDGTRIASCCLDGTIRLWDLLRGREWAVLRGHTYGAGFGVYSVRFDSTGDFLVSGGADRTVRIWDAWCSDRPACADDEGSLSSLGPAPTRELDWVAGHTRRVNGVEWLTDGSQILTGSDDSTLRVSDVASQFDPRQARAVKHGEQGIAASACNEQQTLFAYGTGGLNAFDPGHVVVLDAQTLEEKHRFTELGGPVSRLEFVPGDRLLAVAGSQQATQGAVAMWDLAQGELLWKVDRVVGAIRDLSIDPENNRFATVGNAGQIQLWNLDDGVAISKLGQAGVIFFSVAFSPDGKRLAAGGLDFSVRLFDLESGEELWSRLQHVGAVFSICFDETGDFLFSGSIDGSVRVWRTRFGDQSLTFSTPVGQVLDLAYHPSRRALAVAGNSPFVAIYEAGPLKQAAEDATQEWPIILSDSFEGTELAPHWTSTEGSWVVEEGRAVGSCKTLSELPSAFGCNLILTQVIPSQVDISYDVWSEYPSVVETQLSDRSMEAGFNHVLVGLDNTPLVRGQQGVTSYTYDNTQNVTQLESRPVDEPFTPQTVYRVRSVKDGERWTFYIDGKKVLEVSLPDDRIAPFLMIQALFTPENSLIHIDNVVIRAPAESDMERQARQALEDAIRETQLRELVSLRLESNSQLSEETRIVARQMLALEEALAPTPWSEIIAWLENNETTEQEAFELLNTLELRTDEASAEKQMVLARLAWVSNDFERTLTEVRLGLEIAKKEQGTWPRELLALGLLAQQSLGQEADETWSHAWIELGRSRHWPFVASQKQLLEHESVKALPTRETDDRLESLSSWSFAWQEAWQIDGKLQPLVESLSETFEAQSARSAEPGEFEITSDRDKFIKIETMWLLGGRPIETQLERLSFQVTFDGDRATLDSTWRVQNLEGWYSWQERCECVQVADGWQLTKLRTWPLRVHLGKIIFDPEFDGWEEADRVALSLAQGQLADRVRAYAQAFQNQNAWNDIKVACSQYPDVADVHSAAAERAFFAGDYEGMQAMAMRATELDIDIVGSPMIRAFAWSRMIKRALGNGREPEQVGGRTVIAPMRYQVLDRSAISVPGTPITAWYLPTTSVTLVTKWEKTAGEEDSHSQFLRLADTLMYEALNAEVKFHGKTHAFDEPASFVIYEGLGTGSAIAKSFPGAVPTRQLLIAFDRGDHFEVWLTSSYSVDSARRFIELQLWIKGKDPLAESTTP